KLFFELLNEPNTNLTDAKWQSMIPPLLKTVRETNPNRIVIVGPGHWNSLTSLRNLALPDNDQRLIVTFHYYVPMEFTHQGANWQHGSMRWLGTPWPAEPEDEVVLHKNFQTAADWAKQKGRPVYLGEFGSYSAAEMTSRARWTSAVVQEAQKYGFSWAYWE